MVLWAGGPGFVELFGFFVDYVVVKGDEAGRCGADANCDGLVVVGKIDGKSRRTRDVCEGSLLDGKVIDTC